MVSESEITPVDNHMTDNQGATNWLSKGRERERIAIDNELPMLDTIDNDAAVKKLAVEDNRSESSHSSIGGDDTQPLLH